MLGEVCRAYLLTASDDDNGDIPGLREGWTSGAKCAANACSTSSSSLGEGKLMETHGEISFASQARSVVSMWRPKKIKRRLQSCFDGSCPLHFALGGCMHFFLTSGGMGVPAHMQMWFHLHTSAHETLV